MRVIVIEVICKPRGYGKTYDLIMESAKTGTPILVPYDPRYIINLAREMNVRIPQPMTYGEYKLYRGNGSLSVYNHWNGKILIDEVDGFLKRILDATVETVTCTPDSMNERKDNMNLNNAYGMLVNGEIGFYNEQAKTVLSEIITEINIIVPNKVVEVTFADGKKEKMVCHEEDTFNLRNCLFISIAKHLYKGEYTFEGIEWKAFELMHMKKYVKIVDSALKTFNRKQKETVKLENKKRADQEAAERKRAKKQAYKKSRAAKREQEEKDKQVAIYREAYLQAMDILKTENK